MTQQQPPGPVAGSPVGRLVIRLLRLVLGYVLAVAAGSVLFSAITYFLPEGSIINPWTAGWERAAVAIYQASIMYFLLGSVFGLPYVILASLAFAYLLPRNTATFLLLGALCPSVAIITLGITFAGSSFWGPELLGLMVKTIPSGLVAAWLFGAIGFGFGFRRWRMA